MTRPNAPSGLRLDVVSGALAGHVFRAPTSPVVLGRSAGCEVRLHPHEDRQVSGRHAELAQVRGTWVLRDLGSLNGTYLNGRQVSRDQPVSDGDVIRLGPDGPRLRVGTTAEVFSGEEASTEVTQLSPRIDRTLPSVPVVARRRSRRTRRAWIAAPVLLATLAVGAAALLWSRAQRERLLWERERAELLLRLEDAMAANTRAAAQFEGQLDGLADSLRTSTATVTGLLGELERITQDAGSDRWSALQVRLEEALAGQAELRLAASLDWPTIRARTLGALARVFVERTDGRMESGTAFAVGEIGTLVTAAHLVVGPDGSGRPRRIAAQPAETSDVLPAELVTFDAAEDLAVIRLVSRTASTQLLVLNERLDSLQPGQPLALMGFPLQIAASGDAPPTAARPLASAGILRRVTADRVELSGYGARGASGSPIMDADGSVLGLLRGSVQRDGEQVLIAVPATKIIELLAGPAR